MTALMGLSTVMALARLQVIVSPAAQGYEHLGAQLEALTDHGADLVQVRLNPGADPELADRAFNSARAHALRLHSLLAVGHQVDWARRLQADVVHLGASDPPSEQGRAAVAPYGLVGRSVHNEQELRAGLADPDLAYLNVGPVFGDQSSGVDLIRLAASLAPPQQLGAMPWFAVGGITLERLPEVLEAGAMRIAVGAGVTTAEDPVAATEQLADAMREAWNSNPAMERVRMGAFRLG